jgi:DNA-binding protein H-NS
MPSVADLLARQKELAQQQAALVREIENARRSERSSVIAEIKGLMAEHGVTIADLTARTPRAASSKAAVGRKSSSAGTKVAIKYRNPSTGDTWTGRGLKPKWLTAQLSSGRKLSDFLV